LGFLGILVPCDLGFLGILASLRSWVTGYRGFLTFLGFLGILRAFWGFWLPCVLVLCEYPIRRLKAKNISGVDFRLYDFPETHEISCRPSATLPSPFQEIPQPIGRDRLAHYEYPIRRLKAKNIFGADFDPRHN
jgi:hypothetical protein